MKAGLHRAERVAAHAHKAGAPEIGDQGKLVAYEAHVNTNGKKSEVQVGPDGKALAHPE